MSPQPLSAETGSRTATATEPWSATLPDTLVPAFFRFPERPFVTYASADSDVQLSRGEFIALATRFARAFREANVAAGERVVLVLPPGLDVMAAFVGAMLLNAVPTIIAYPNFKIDPAKYVHGLDGLVERLSARVVVVDRDFPVALRKRIEAVAPSARILSIEPLEHSDVIDSAPTASVASDVAFIQHSAGTTGLQKGVELSHKAVVNQLRHLADVMAINQDDRVITWLPLYHDMGLIASFILPLACGIPVVMQSPIEWVLAPSRMLELSSRFRCTLCWLPNFAFQFLARRTRPEAKAELDLRSLRAIVNCSEPVRANSCDEFFAAFESCGLSETAIHCSYAMAENTFAVTQSVIGSRVTRVHVNRELLRDQNRAVLTTPSDPMAIGLLSSGRCLPANKLKVVDGNGATVPDGEVGELVVQSDSMLTGYISRPDLTERALTGGWYRTSDIGFINEGDVYVLGRIDDTIVVAGRNVWPADIEEAVSGHPDVHDGRVVAFGVLNSRLGTQDVVVVAEGHGHVGDDSARIEAEIRQLIVREVDVTATFVRLLQPHWIVKSSAGKPARSATRAKFLAAYGHQLGIAADTMDWPKDQ